MSGIDPAALTSDAAVNAWKGEAIRSAHPAAELIARAFHEQYEGLAANFGYETREASAKPWADVPEQNKRLMVAVVDELLRLGVIAASALSAQGTPDVREGGVSVCDACGHRPPNGLDATGLPCGAELAGGAKCGGAMRDLAASSPGKGTGDAGEVEARFATVLDEIIEAAEQGRLGARNALEDVRRLIAIARGTSSGSATTDPRAEFERVVTWLQGQGVVLAGGPVDVVAYVEDFGIAAAPATTDTPNEGGTRDGD